MTTSNQIDLTLNTGNLYATLNIQTRIVMSKIRVLFTYISVIQSRLSSFPTHKPLGGMPLAFTADGILSVYQYDRLGNVITGGLLEAHQWLTGGYYQRTTTITISGLPAGQ